MLPQQNVKIVVYSRNKRYIKLGYDLPLKIEKSGFVLDVKIEHLALTSRVKVKFICDYCNGSNQSTEESKYKQYYKLNRSRKIVNKDSCINRDCTQSKAWEVKNLSIELENTFGFRFPEVLEEWSSLNDLTPFNYHFSSERLAYWHCAKCGSDYEMMVKLKGKKYSGCPYCSSHRINETNCLWTTHPKIAALLKDPERGYEISHGRNFREEFICEDCGTLIFKSPLIVTSQGLACNACSDGISYPEKFIYNVLNQIPVEIEREKRFDWAFYEGDKDYLKGIKKYDFYLPKLNCIIEAHGEQHYIISRRKLAKSLEQIKENDYVKRNLAIKNGFTYIELNCSVSDLNFIKSEILKSRLAQIVSLDHVDWEIAHYYANHSLVKVTADLFNEGNNVNEIVKILNLSNTTVRRYLHQGNKIKLCNYNGMNVIMQNRELAIKKIKRRVVQLEINGDFVSEWESIAKAQRTLKINNISAVCRGKQSTAGGYKWTYN